MVRVSFLAIIATAAAGCTCPELEATVKEHEATLSKMQEEHREAMKAVEIRFVALEAMINQWPPGPPFEGHTASGSIVGRNLLSTGPGNPPVTRIDSTSVETRNLTVTNIHMDGTLYWRGEAWEPQQPSPVPSPVPNPVPTPAPTVLGGAVAQFAYVSSNTKVTIDSTSFVEPSVDYRVIISPKDASNTVKISYQIPTNPGSSYARNTIYTFKAFKIIGGVKSYSLTSAGGSSGSRNSIAGMAIRPVGFDANDPMWANFEVIDQPGTTSAVTYGFDFKRGTGGSGNLYFGYSACNCATSGFSSDVTIAAEEYWPDGVARSSNFALAQFVFKASNFYSVYDSTSFIEPSIDYRVSITPKASDSIIRLRYQVPCQPGDSYASNTIYTYRAFRMVGGVKSYDLTSAGLSLGSRNTVAGLVIRPVGYDR